MSLCICSWHFAVIFCFFSYLFPAIYFSLLFFTVSFLSVSADSLNHRVFPSASARFLSCTLQSAAVGGQVVWVAAPPPEVVAESRAVPEGPVAAVILQAVRVRWGCLSGRWTALEKHRTQLDSIRAEAISYLCRSCWRWTRSPAEWSPRGFSRGVPLHPDSPPLCWQSANTLWKATHLSH